MRRLAAIGAVLAPAVLSAPAAAQDVPYRGVTTQGGLVTLTADERGRTGGFTVRWRAGCTNGRVFRRQVTTFALLGEEARPARRITARDRFKAPDRGGRIGTIVMRMTGRFVESPRGPGLRRWEGTVRARIVVRRHGRVSERCAMGARWRAMPEGIGTGRFTAATEPREPDETPASFAYDATSATISALGTREVVHFDLEANDDRLISVIFRAPALNRLRAGQRYEGHNLASGAASVSMSGTDLCAATGDFAITAMRFDRLRRLVHFAATFEATCSSPYEIVRGSLEWRAAS